MATANASLVLVISTVHGRPSELVSAAPHSGVNAIAAFLEGAANGSQYASVDVYSTAAAPVAASQTVTLASVADADTITIGGVVLTAKTSPSGQAQWARGGTNTADATALKNCINAHTTLSKVLVASSNGAVVTITALEKGLLGNLVTLAAAATMTLGASALASGAGGVSAAATTWHLGL